MDPQNNPESRVNPQLVHAPVIDWSKTPLANVYAGYYLKIVDNIITPEECTALIKLGELNTEWQPAGMDYGTGFEKTYVDTQYRNNQRILKTDHDAAERLYQKLFPYMQELVEIKKDSPWEGVVGGEGPIVGKWRMIGINERLSFLRYGKGTYFKPHTDGLLDLPDGRKSRVIIQVYLGEDGLEGGATRIMDIDSNYIDVEPKKGRVLIFQQRGIYHSGEEVTKGVKYALRAELLFRQIADEHD